MQLKLFIKPTIFKIFFTLFFSITVIIDLVRSAFLNINIGFLTSIASICYLLASPVLPLINYLVIIMQGLIGQYNVFIPLIIIPGYYYLIACVINFVYEEIQARKINKMMEKKLENMQT